jgi:hypothetical protein
MLMRTSHQKGVMQRRLKQHHLQAVVAMYLLVPSIHAAELNVEQAHSHLHFPRQATDELTYQGLKSVVACSKAGRHIEGVSWRQDIG